MVEEIIILRYGHRDVRDYRVTSHCALVGRALGATKIIICGEKEEGVKKSVDDVTKRWGGPFKVEFSKNWKKSLKNLQKKGFRAVHLTMYGVSINSIEKELIRKKKLVFIIGSQKVEKEVYYLTDYNVSVGTQPHSEIAALAIAIDRVQKGKEIQKAFRGAKIRIEPQPRGKKVIPLK